MQYSIAIPKNIMSHLKAAKGELADAVAALSYRSAYYQPICASEMYEELLLVQFVFFAAQTAAWPAMMPQAGGSAPASSGG
mmetsp:Transcript_34731/g.64300  ORF Transcript_34731/g.64300 Transcript_34731/m.64300 type:complete len:81 (-) Transcript_34731:28-270(-)